MPQRILLSTPGEVWHDRNVRTLGSSTKEIIHSKYLWRRFCSTKIEMKNTNTFLFYTRHFLCIWKRNLQDKALRVNQGQVLCLAPAGFIRLSTCLSFPQKPFKQRYDLKGPVRIYYIHNNVQCINPPITQTHSPHTYKHMCMNIQIYTQDASFWCSVYLWFPVTLQMLHVEP